MSVPTISSTARTVDLILQDAEHYELPQPASVRIVPADENSGAYVGVDFGSLDDFLAWATWLESTPLSTTAGNFATGRKRDLLIVATHYDDTKAAA